MSVTVDIVNSSAAPGRRGGIRGPPLDLLGRINAIGVVSLYAVSMTAKTRLSVTVDADLITASQAAVRAGEAESVSAWVNDALRLKVEHDRRLRGVDDFVAAFEAEYGEITDEEMDAAYRASKARAIVVRSGQVVSDGHSGVA